MESLQFEDRALSILGREKSEADLTLDLPGGADEAAIVAEAVRRGIFVYGLSGYRSQPGLANQHYCWDIVAYLKENQRERKSARSRSKQLYAVISRLGKAKKTGYGSERASHGTISAQPYRLGLRLQRY